MVNAPAQFNTQLMVGMEIHLDQSYTHETLDDIHRVVENGLPVFQLRRLSHFGRSIELAE
jgi:hypothetical protein